jgi:hypothetical protein
MDRDTLIRGKDLLVYLNHSVTDVLNRHRDITAIFITEIPEYLPHLRKMAEIYGSMYKPLTCDVIIEKGCDKPHDYYLAMNLLADENLSKIAPIKDDCVLFEAGEVIMEIVTGDVHYICRVNDSDLNLLRKKIRI